VRSELMIANPIPLGLKLTLVHGGGKEPGDEVELRPGSGRGTGCLDPNQPRST